MHDEYLPELAQTQEKDVQVRCTAFIPRTHRSHPVPQLYPIVPTAMSQSHVAWRPCCWVRCDPVVIMIVRAAHQCCLSRSWYVCRLTRPSVIGPHPEQAVCALSLTHHTSTSCARPASPTLPFLSHQHLLCRPSPVIFAPLSVLPTAGRADHVDALLDAWGI